MKVIKAVAGSTHLSNTQNMATCPVPRVLSLKILANTQRITQQATTRKESHREVTFEFSK